ncbi:MAG: phosphatidylinositol-specific phospholipase C1-like protein [Ferruginibacter sp.]|nr:phosphatidylinositol-specific phospholipase C1-like protein [Cytophagales bacterium]
MNTDNRSAGALLIALTFGWATACQPISQRTPAATTPPLKLNQIQVVGSHNSYKGAIEPALMRALMARDSALFLSLDYQHIPLPAQLDLGLRKLEIDVVHDPQGGRYARPLGIALVEQSGQTPLPFDSLGKMKSPGFKVLHVQDIDFRSQCLRLRDCLQEIKDWSRAHPNHLPIAVSFNAKTDLINQPGFVRPLAFTSATFDSLDAEIRAVFPPEYILTPDQVRGEHPSLEAAVKAQHWPSLADCRGKVLFVLDEGGEKRASYVRGHPSLRGRVMFVNAPPGQPEAAFIILNDPIQYRDSIQSLVRSGYLVRTRADEGTREARAGDYRRWEAALASGAHFISTDYYRADERFGTGYRIQLPAGAVARCNPVASPDGCGNERLE